MYLSNNINYRFKTKFPSLSGVSYRFIPSAPSQRVALCYVIVFYVRRVIFRFDVAGVAAAVCRGLIAVGQKIPVWVTEFETFWPVLGFPVSHCYILCGRCAAP